MTYRFEAGIRDVVEDALPSTDHDGDEVEDELVDHLGCKRLPHVEAPPAIPLRACRRPLSRTRTRRRTRR
jgi:hypothetical protein